MLLVQLAEAASNVGISLTELMDRQKGFEKSLDGEDMSKAELKAARAVDPGRSPRATDPDILNDDQEDATEEGEEEEK